MLPKITLDFSTIVLGQIEPESREWHAVGHAYCYVGDKLKEAALAENRNMDEFLMIRLAYDLIASKRKTAMLIYQNNLNMVHVTICGKHLPIISPLLLETSGLFEQGNGYVTAHIPPYMYYDGQKVYRLHYIARKDRKKKTLITDMGMMVSGPSVAECLKGRFKQIRDERNNDNYDYSAVPDISVQTYEFNNKKLVVHHVIIDHTKSNLGLNPNYFGED